MPKSRFFRVAVEGATSDGRAIDRKWLEEMAASYNPATYAARVNLEHVRGMTAEPPFQALGDVLSVKTEEVIIDLGGKQEKKLALFAEIEALDPLVAMNKKGQKLYTSIEVNPSFADTGKAYLVGLAVTDSPASLGTEMLQFAASQGDKNPLAARKQTPGNLFTAAAEADIQLIEDPAAADPTGVFASVKAFFDGMAKAAAPAQVQTSVDPATAAASANPATPATGAADANFTALTALVGGLATTLQQFMASQTAAQAELRRDLDALKTAAEAAPAKGFNHRPPATGSETGRPKTTF